ncbi:MAG: helix-hairpin-helix domain-containing protein [Bacteroidia bacterium]|nr:helix-hairpin-helix domain-containing protein [Bacteroidia bacterium]
MINTFLSNYFGFNRQQRNGLFVLSLISFILLLVRLIYPVFITPDDILIEQLPLIKNTIAVNLVANDSAKNNQLEKSEEGNLFVFNPNTVNFEQLIKLGFKEKTAKRFIKFRSKGFVFKTKKDLQKVYGISDDFYTQLEAYILIDSKSSHTQFAKNNAKDPESRNLKIVSKKQAAVTELNSADSLALIAINGIGPSFAKRILKYRNALGGFAVLEQLKEVYGFTEEMYVKISPLVKVNPSLIKKLNLSKDDFKIINKHPYISYELTKSIFDWRRKTDITAANLKGIVNNDELYQKLLPYLSFE